ncbi:ferredoxin reductase, partial [Streptomyces sp. NPDC059627]
MSSPHLATASSAVLGAERRVRVARRRTVAAGVLEVTFTCLDPAEVPLAAWAPGAHVDVVLPSGRVRQYSLCGPAQNSGEYVIAVLRETTGRGGSAEVHDRLPAGTVVAIRGPRDHFRLDHAGHYLFLAGGIGITPILAMAREVAPTGTPWTLVYGGRTRASMAYTDELTELAEISHGSVHLVPQDEHGHPDFAAALRDLPAGTAVYACGPEAMLQA